ncbi:hypothetical protein J5Y09_09825 [Roseomonas sp. PWR1]|uniref:Transmembrane protein n=1 Tax=Roseomonas nitratireducens TaxID=2820810 RepID=A0ABS4AS73_9PROT|nr:hypothetical protein [Neoroseomonas nitratireducens]MBP0464210.1 hypothetical protein [Neoroseomonas nitratireducens]
MTRQVRAVLGGILGATATGVWVAGWRWVDPAPLSGDVVASGAGIGFALAWAVLEWPALMASLATARSSRVSELLTPLDADAPGMPRLGKRVIRGRFAMLVLVTTLMLLVAMVGLREGSVGLILGGALIAALTGWFAAGDLVTLRRRRREPDGLRRMGQR